MFSALAVETQGGDVRVLDRPVRPHVCLFSLIMPVGISPLAKADRPKAKNGKGSSRTSGAGTAWQSIDDW